MPLAALDGIRGWLVLEMAVSSEDDRRLIKAATRNRLAYSEIRQALLGLFEERLQGKGSGKVPGHGGLRSNGSQRAYYQDFETEETYDQNAEHYGFYSEEPYGQDYIAENDEEWQGEENYEAEEWENEEEMDEELLRLHQEQEEHEKNKMELEALLGETDRNLIEARKAVAAGQKDRGWTGTVQQRQPRSTTTYPWKGNPKGRGKGKPQHLGKARTQEGNWVQGGKGKTKFTYGNNYSKGKGKHTKGKGYGSNYSMGMMEVEEEFDDQGMYPLMMAATPASREPCKQSRLPPHQSLVDTGATATAGGKQAVQDLCKALVSSRPNLEVTVFETARPWFRFGNGKWGRALYKVTLKDPFTEVSMSIYALPAVDVPVLTGMKELQHLNCVINCTTGLYDMAELPLKEEIRKAVREVVQEEIQQEYQLIKTPKSKAKSGYVKPNDLAKNATSSATPPEAVAIHSEDDDDRWNLPELQHFIKQYQKEFGPLYFTQIDGCQHGMKSPDGQFIQKSWLVMNNDPEFHDRCGRKCDQSHTHRPGGMIGMGSKAVSETAFYPKSMVEGIARLWKSQWQRNIKASPKEVYKAIMAIDNDMELERKEDRTGQERKRTKGESELQAVPKEEIEQTKAMLHRLHRAAGHPNNRSLARLCQDRGLPPWVTQLALEMKCQACLETKKGAQMTLPSSIESRSRPWQMIGLDTFELYFPKLKTKARYLLMTCLTMRFTSVHLLWQGDAAATGTESGQKLIHAFVEGWLLHRPRPEWVMVDAQTSLAKGDFAAFCQSIGIGVTAVPGEAHWQHGSTESMVKALKNTMKKVRSEHSRLSPKLVALLASSAQNHGDRVRGYSPVQWAYGLEPGAWHLEHDPLEVNTNNGMNTAEFWNHDLKENLILEKKNKQSLRMNGMGLQKDRVQVPDHDQDREKIPSATTILPGGRCEFTVRPGGRKRKVQNYNLDDEEGKETMTMQALSEETGMDIYQLFDIKNDNMPHDYTIYMTQEKFCGALRPVTIEQESQRKITDRLSPAETTQARALTMKAQWRAIQTAPQFCARIGLLASSLKDPTIKELKEANAIMRELRKTSKEDLVMHSFNACRKRKLKWNDLIAVHFADAGLNNRPCGGATGGHVSCLSDPSVLTGAESKMSMIDWRSWKLDRPSKGSNGAEGQAIYEGEDRGWRLRLFWALLNGEKLTRQNSNLLASMTESLLVMDSRGCDLNLADSLTKATYESFKIMALYHTKKTWAVRFNQEFVSNHMFVGIQDFMAENFYTPAFDNYAVITVIFGIAGLDTSGINVYDPGAFIGTPIFDDSFDLTTSEAQTGMLDICSKLRTITCDLEGCDNSGYDTFVMQTTERTVSCFLEDFQQWLGGPLPTGANFTTQLQAFRSAADKGAALIGTYRNALRSEDIGFIDGELKYVALHFRSVMKKRLPFSIGISIENGLLKLGDCLSGALPSSLKSMKFHGNGEFQRYDMGEELINGLFSGIAIAMPISFLVLLSSTQNVVVAIYAVLSVGAIVLCVLGFCKSAMDWDLGVGEAIAGVIVIGYSVDYVVHLAHMYSEGMHFGHQTRDERAKFAIRNMGSTIFAGAITTMLAGATMFVCWFYFFIKMALLICVTIMYSFLFSLVFFMSLLWTAGQPHCTPWIEWNVHAKGPRSVGRP
ncbi:unnamed protein product [Durusdinium trenchii]|uniref:Integrase catalytic domain-containing protein n=1 Tax=Durusdinium trenchii TaxID=1381693 RepID=A0ABP0IGF0_9DINO